MTKRLEEELGLPPIEDVRIPDEIEETLPTVEESQEEIAQNVLMVHFLL
jgi:hypothetical protein